MPKVFLSYRRDDGAAYAGRLYDRLAAEFGTGQVFMDIDQIEPGEDFVEVIETNIGVSTVLVVLIGRQWTSLVDQAGSRRLDNPEDFVRLEVDTALERGIRIIPVLVGGASMPLAQDVPQPLRPLTRRQAIELSDLRFHSDVDHLIETIEKKAGVEGAVVVNDLQPKYSESAESVASDAKDASDTVDVRVAPPTKRPAKLWLGRLLMLATIGFIASLGVGWMHPRPVDHGLSSPGFWEADIWVLWPSFTILFGVLFAIARRFRDRER